MNADAVPQLYDDEGSCWYAAISYDEVEGEDPIVDVFMGQMPGFFSKVYTDSELKCTLYLVNGDKKVEFNITLKVNAAVEVNANTTLAELEIVKEYSTDIELYPSTGGFETSIELPGIAEALGMTDEMFAKVYKSSMFGLMPETDPTTEEVVISKQLMPITETDSWFGRTILYDEMTDTETVVGTLHYWGGGCTIFLHDASLADGTLTFADCGQYGGTMKAGDEDSFSIYVINGNKAAKLNFNIKMLEKEFVPFEQINWVERKVIDAKTKIQPDYGIIEVEYDADEVLEKLGASSWEEVSPFNLAAEGQFQEPTVNDYWQGADGISVGWGADAIAKVYPSDFNMASGKITLMQMHKEYTEVVGPCPIRYYFVYGTNGYELTINYTIDPAYNPNEGVEFKQVDSQYYPIQIKVSTNGNTNEDSSGLLLTPFDTELIENALGADFADLTFCYNTKDATEAGEFNFVEFTAEAAKWMDETGNYIASWTSTSAYGMVYHKEGSVSWYQFSADGNSGARVDGDHYTGNFYVVNFATGDFVKIVLDVTYVDELTPDVDVVGTEELAFEASEANYDAASGVYKLAVDLAKACETLGVADVASAGIVAPRSIYTYDAYEPAEDITYNKNGYVSSVETEIVCLANMEISGNTATVTVDTQDIVFDSEEPVSVPVRLGIEVEGKRYMFVITLANNAYMTPINAVQATSAATIYSVSGIKANALSKGVNIVKMADGSVKKVIVK